MCFLNKICGKGAEQVQPIGLLDDELDDVNRLPETPEPTCVEKSLYCLKRSAGKFFWGCTGLAACVLGLGWLFTFSLPGAFIGGLIGARNGTFTGVQQGLGGSDNPIMQIYALSEGVRNGMGGAWDGAKKGAFFGFIWGKMAFEKAHNL